MHAVEAVDVLQFAVRAAAAVLEADRDDASAEHNPVAREPGEPPEAPAVGAVDSGGSRRSRVSSRA